MQVWLGVHLLQPRLDAYRYSEAGLPQVVLHQGQVWACGGQAWKAGVRPGMRQAGARALAPELDFIVRRTECEQQLCREIELALLPFSPLLAWQREDALVLDVSASLRLFGGVRRLYARVRESLQRLGLAARLALAPSACGAWLLARAPQAARRRVLRVSRLAACLDGLPLALLDEPGSRHEWLASLGCDTFGALRRLPRAGLRERQAAGLLLQLDRAYGNTGECYEWVRPPEHFCSQVQSLFSVERHEALCWLAQRLLVQLTAWLDARQLAVSELRWSLHHEGRQRSSPRTHLDMKLAQPAWEAGHLAHLLAERLARNPLPAPVSAMTLEAMACQARAGTSGNLLAQAGASGDVAALQDVLAARLGAESILLASPVADHRPERACRWLPYQAMAGDRAMGSLPDSAAWADRQASRSPRPFWLLETPLPLPAAAGGGPMYGGAALHVLGGPERIEDGWWEGGTARDYFMARHASSGVCYWVFRQRGAGEAAGGLVWFLHGIYA